MSADTEPGSGATGGRVTRHATVSVAELRRRLGERMAIVIDMTLPPLTVVASRSIGDEPITGSVIVESIERGVTVYGSIRFRWAGECRRCLEEVTGTVTSEIDEIFQVAAPPDADLVDLVEDKVDLLPLVRDAVLAGLPLAPLCREECAGPDPERYPTLVAADDDEEGESAERPIDPRWAGLEVWRSEDG